MEWFEEQIREEWEQRDFCGCCPCCGCTCSGVNDDPEAFEEFKREKYIELEKQTIKDFEKEVLEIGAD